ncbi:MAG TPA: uridine kinase [bacterium]|nr:uridine kinase [bacterium]
MKREELLEKTAGIILSIKKPHPLRVAVDGMACSGKTVFSDGLAGVLSRSKRPVIRASIDGFHNPAAVRHKNGRECPRGYYLHSFNHGAAVEKILKPLGPGGDKKYLKSVYDYRVEKETGEPVCAACDETILVFDGIFLLIPGMAGFWDYTIRLEADCDAVLARAVRRDIARFGDEDSIREKYLKRFIPGQKLYEAEVNPAAAADITINNSDYEEPFIQKEKKPGLKETA